MRINTIMLSVPLVYARRNTHVASGGMHPLIILLSTSGAPSGHPNRREMRWRRGAMYVNVIRYKVLNALIHWSGNVNARMSTMTNCRRVPHPEGPLGSISVTCTVITIQTTHHKSGLQNDSISLNGVGMVQGHLDSKFLI